jgi:RNase H-like domain found in reverse transcriptase
MESCGKIRSLGNGLLRKFSSFIQVPSKIRPPFTAHRILLDQQGQQAHLKDNRYAPRRWHIEGAFTLDTDASDHQLGCCLLQEQPDGTQKPIGYWSRGLTSAEKNYSTTEK